MIWLAWILFASALAYVLVRALGSLERIEYDLATLKLKEAMIMANVQELLARIQAFRDEVIPQLDAAVKDIQRIHDLLDAGTGPVDVSGAMAALDEVSARFVALKEKVDLPEGTPPTP